MGTVTKRKAFAYITHQSKLLVFTQPDSPEAGIQVPAGSIENGESSRDGALREAIEETGLTEFTVKQFLGEQIRDMRDYDKNEIHHRYFYHLVYDGNPSEKWEHGERFPSDAPNHDGSITHLFSLYWVDINNPPKLIADHDFYIEALQSLLRANEEHTNQQ